MFMLVCIYTGATDGEVFCGRVSRCLAGAAAAAAID